MSKNKILPYILTSTDQHALKASVGDTSWLSHYRYGHLNFKSLALMYEHNFVDGLPIIKNVDDICENYIVGK